MTDKEKYYFPSYQYGFLSSLTFHEGVPNLKSNIFLLFPYAADGTYNYLLLSNSYVTFIIHQKGSKKTLSFQLLVWIIM